jgi:hypothetical protein
MITKQQLENAARAIGLLIEDWTDEGVAMYKRTEADSFVWDLWNPLSPTTQGKSDLVDLILFFPLDVSWYHDSVTVRKKRDIIEDVYFINGEKHASLAEAVVSVASQTWESKQ